MAFVEISLTAEHCSAMCGVSVMPEWVADRHWCLLAVGKDLMEEYHEVVANDLGCTRCFDFVAG